MSYFASYSVASGLQLNEFANLDRRTRKKLIRLMSRIAERSYRRGVQHGEVSHGDPNARDDLYEWRYRSSLDLSPWVDSPTTETSVSRLFAENGELRALGFEEPKEARLGFRPAVWTGYCPERRKTIKQAAAS